VDESFFGVGVEPPLHGGLGGRVGCMGQARRLRYDLEEQQGCCSFSLCASCAFLWLFLFLFLLRGRVGSVFAFVGEEVAGCGGSARRLRYGSWIVLLALGFVELQVRAL
jgi:hypothetical protein